jgi:aryl-phospho-beta-D-glucosidase BglC (GH1 family)
MKKVGLNSVRMPVGWWFFAEHAGINGAPYVLPDEDLFDEQHPITQAIKWANDAGLQVQHLTLATTTLLLSLQSISSIIW